MVVVTIVRLGYKPTYNKGSPHCVYIYNYIYIYISVYRTGIHWCYKPRFLHCQPSSPKLMVVVDQL